ncbi:hypothetical protein M2281_005030 [Mesorhizobium soli]|jgi:hypothetical protein|uniref:hypothetical protein n=1 Tax=Pseudaminobacter soli (ex Li et al. 2025) TaxID=1295366 RepID=UPI0024771984|nr:hypothetical protein [Mesorhizobium soli]MDH6234412.1 hypothetical protein [Mesorhizobium soli]
MNLVDLILTVCLTANPTHCQDEHLYFESLGSLNQCIVLAQPQIAKWVGEHPTFTVVRWTCAFPKKEKSI